MSVTVGACFKCSHTLQKCRNYALIHLFPDFFVILTLFFLTFVLKKRTLSTAERVRFFARITTLPALGQDLLNTLESNSLLAS